MFINFEGEIRSVQELESYFEIAIFWVVDNNANGALLVFHCRIYMQT